MDVERWDQVFAAVSHGERRRLLLRLFDGESYRPIDEDGLAGGRSPRELELFHNHLPKLHGLGYITWERSNGLVHQGPRWDEIEPLLEFLSQRMASRH